MKRPLPYAVTALAAGVALAALLPAADASASTAPAPRPGLGAATSAAPAGALPTGFVAQSTAWVGSKQGWVLGKAPCGDHTCAKVAGTDDSGATWKVLGRTHTPIPKPGRRKHPGVTEIRFGTAQTGWAFAPLLRHSDDGGRTWTEQAIPGNGGQVLSLTTDADGSWMVVSPCIWGHSGSCRKQPLTLWRTTTAAGTRWTQVKVNLPFNFAADITSYGTTVYVVDPQLEFGGEDLLYASTDGRTFESRPAPCSHPDDLELLQAVATSASHVALLCDGDPGFSKAVKIVYTSSDTGTTDVSRGQMGLLGIQAELAASPSGNLAVASASDGSFIYANDSGKTWTMPVGLGDGGVGWNDIVYVSNATAYVVYSPANGFEPRGQLWVTHDAGTTWGPIGS